MFFIMGVSQGQKKLNFDQLIVCGRCGRYGHLEVYMVYSYLSLFFIPVLKWDAAIMCEPPAAMPQWSWMQSWEEKFREER